MTEKESIEEDKTHKELLPMFTGITWKLILSLVIIFSAIIFGTIIYYFRGIGLFLLYVSAWTLLIYCYYAMSKPIKNDEK